jgi:hypothetical protein
MKSKLRLVAVAAAMLVAGCSTITPKEMPKDHPASEEAARQAMAISEGWNAPSVVRDGQASIVLMTPYAIPREIKNRHVAVELEPGATIQDVVASLGHIGVPVLLADEAAGAHAFYLPHFDGTLGTLLSAISRATDVWFTYSDGAIVVSSTERIGVSVPQDTTFADTLSKGLDALGIKEKAITGDAGMVTMDITPSQFRKTREYLSRLTNNAAFVTLQIAVLNVTLNQNAKQGIDWANLQFSALKGGSPLDVQAWQKALGTGTNSTSGTTGSTTGGSTTTSSTTTSTGSTATDTTGTSSTGSSTTDTLGSVARSVASLGVTGGALQGLAFGGRFNFSGLFDFLQTYGDTKTTQNVLLKTVSGNKVSFKSLTQIPYVSEIGVTTSTSSNNNTALGSTQTDKADDGIEVDMTPRFDASANTVTIDMKLSIKAVLAFNQLSAGNQLGTLTQPTTADRSFTDILRMRPGQTVVVGGLQYDSVTNDHNSPLFLQDTKAEHQALTISRQSMFIVVRSNVARIGQVLEDGNEDLKSSEYLELPTAAHELPTRAEKKPAARAAKTVAAE